MSAKPKAVWCTPHAYRSVTRVGAHHLSAALAARGWDVLFLSNPVSPLHALKWRNPEVGLRLAQAARGITQEVEGLRTMLPVTLLPLTGSIGARSQFMLNHWPAFTVPQLGSRLRCSGFARPDLLVVDGPIGAPLIEILKPRRSVLRLLDRLSGFASTTEAMLATMADAARRVDLVTYSAQDLAADVERLEPQRRLHLANGVDVMHFRAVRSMPKEYAAIPKPRAVYVGAMAEWFDFELITRAARERPAISFVLIGPQDLARRRLPALRNLFLLGTRPWSELPSYLQHADVGMIPFDIHQHFDLVRGVNPLKLYEYAAAGLPVVSVAWPELHKLNAPIELADTAEEFISAMDRTLEEKPSVETLRAFAARHDWSAAVDRLLAGAELAPGGGDRARGLMAN
jgi:glycosyltransferase involved in cell wall biosynthesis